MCCFRGLTMQVCFFLAIFLVSGLKAYGSQSLISVTLLGADVLQQKFGVRVGVRPSWYDHVSTFASHAYGFGDGSPPVGCDDFDAPQ